MWPDLGQFDLEGQILCAPLRFQASITCIKVLVNNRVGYIMNPTDVGSWAPNGKIPLNHISLNFFYSLIPLYESLYIISFCTYGYCNTSLGWTTCCITITAILVFQTTYFYTPEGATCEMDQICDPDSRLWASPDIVQGLYIIPFVQYNDPGNTRICCVWVFYFLLYFPFFSLYCTKLII